MAASLGHVLAQLHRWTSPRLGELPDRVLLERFHQQRDESAFAALMARYGGMVLRSCRRVLGDGHEAEDAFQATFFILARKVDTLRRPGALPGFLHSIARRVALKARTRSAGRAGNTPLVEKLPDPHSDPLTQLTARELLSVLDEEVGRLPRAQRSAVILCCLEGQTREEAAKMLGCTEGSLKGHLERGRRRLQERLHRRSIALSAALALVAIARNEAVSASLLQNTAKAVLGGGGSAAALAHSVLKTMFTAKLAGVVALTVTLALAVSTTVALFFRGPVEAPKDKTPAVFAASKDADAGKAQGRADAPDDPLPAGAIARLGTQRLRHGGWIRFATFTPDGKRLVSQGQDGVRIWDAATGKELGHIAPEPGKMWSAADLSPDGKQVAGGMEDSNGQIGLWDISSGKKITSFGRGYYPLVRFSPDGKRLAAFESAEAPRWAVEVWDVASRRKLLSWKAHGGHQVASIFFSPDSQKLFTCAIDGKVRVWDAATGRQLREFTRLDWKLGRNHLSAFTQNEALSPDGKLLALWEENEKSTSKSGADEWKARISLRDTTTGEQVRLLTCPTQQGARGQALAFSAMTFTPDGKKLLTGGPDHFLRVWDAATGDELQRWPLQLDHPWALALPRDGKTLAAVMNQGKAIQLLDMASGKPRPSHTGHLAPVYFTALSHKGRTAVTLSQDHFLLWDVASNRIRHVLKGHDGSISGLQLARDGRTLYTLGEDKSVRVWDLANGEERRRFSLERDFEPSAFGALALSPDGAILAVQSMTKTIHLLDTTSGRELYRFEGPESVLGASFAADGRCFVIWSGDRKVRIWDTVKGLQMCEYTLSQDLRVGQPKFVGGGSAPPPTYYHAALSPDGRQLAIGNDRHVLPVSKCFLVFKDLETGRDIRRIEHLPADVHRLAFSPDGRMLAWGGNSDPTIFLMETASGGVRRHFTGHSGPVLSLAFSADGERLISGSMDTAALVWDVGRRLDPRKAQAPLTPAEVAKLWADIGSEDAARAYQAIQKLVANPDVSVPFLRRQLRPVPATDEKHLARLIADLDSDDFARREKATAELQKLGEQALPAYRKALEDKPSLETRRRLEDLQTKAYAAWWDVSGERLRSLRAIEVLELAGTEEARQVLEMLTAGATGARLTEEAKAARKRLQ